MLDKIHEENQSSFPFWQILGLLGLFIVIASVSMVDPRPNALESLSATLKVLSAHAKRDTFGDKQK